MQSPRHLALSTIGEHIGNAVSRDGDAGLYLQNDLPSTIFRIALNR